MRILSKSRCSPGFPCGQKQAGHSQITYEIPANVGMERGVGRDIARDGVDNSKMWEDIWMPLEEKYRNEQKPDQCADFVFDGTQ